MGRDSSTEEPAVAASLQPAPREPLWAVEQRIKAALSDKPAHLMIATSDAEVLSAWTIKGGHVERSSPTEPWAQVQTLPDPRVIRMWMARGFQFRLRWDPQILDNGAVLPKDMADDVVDITEGALRPSRSTVRAVVVSEDRSFLLPTGTDNPELAEAEQAVVETVEAFLAALRRVRTDPA